MKNRVFFFLNFWCISATVIMFFHFSTHSHGLTWILSHDINKMGGRIRATSDGAEAALTLLHPLKKPYWNVSEDGICYGCNFESTLLKSFTGIKNLL